MDLSEKINNIQKKSQELNEKKIRFQERLRSEQKKLSDLFKEIKAKGFNPNDLEKIKAEKEKELKESLQTVETSLTEAEHILKEIEDLDAATNQ